MLALLDQAEPFVADDNEALIAKDAACKLKTVADAHQDIQIVVSSNPGVVVPLPARAVELIHRLLVSMAEGVPISVIPHAAELSTQQAADFLNVSRPYFIKLLEDGKIPYQKVGRHRRVLFSNLRTFQNDTRASRLRALQVLADEEAKLDLD